MKGSRETHMPAFYHRSVVTTRIYMVAWSPIEGLATLGPLAHSDGAFVTSPTMTPLGFTSTPFQLFSSRVITGWNLRRRWPAQCSWPENHEKIEAQWRFSWPIFCQEERSIVFEAAGLSVWCVRKYAAQHRVSLAGEMWNRPMMLLANGQYYSTLHG